jgi:hypothetical protein
VLFCCARDFLLPDVDGYVRKKMRFGLIGRISVFQVNTKGIEDFLIFKGMITSAPHKPAKTEFEKYLFDTISVAFQFLEIENLIEKTDTRTNVNGIVYERNAYQSKIWLLHEQRCFWN